MLYECHAGLKAVWLWVARHMGECGQVSRKLITSDRLALHLLNDWRILMK